MSCPLCDMSFDRMFYRDGLWYAVFEPFAIMPGHTLLVREPPPCPIELTKDGLQGFDRAIDALAPVLRQEYETSRLLITSLRGTVAHIHFHLFPLHPDAEADWRLDAHYQSGHLHQLLGDFEHQAWLHRDRRRLTLNQQREFLQPSSRRIRWMRDYFPGMWED